MKKVLGRRMSAVALTLVLVAGLIPAGNLKSIRAESDSVYQLDTAKVVTCAKKSKETTGGDNNDYFTINASEGDIIVEESKKEVNGVRYLNRLKLAKSGSNKKQNISFTTDSSYAIVKITAVSGSSSASDRGLTISDDKGNVVDACYADKTELREFTYYLSGKGTYYIYSDNSGINIYNVEVTQTENRPQMAKPDAHASSAGADSVISWSKVPGADSYEIYSSADGYTAPAAKIAVKDNRTTDYEETITENTSGSYSYKVKAVSGEYGDALSDASEEITVDSNGSRQSKLNEDDWSYARLGTQSDKMKVPVYTKSANTLVLDTLDQGKMANTGQSGFVFYYTKIKSSDYNASIRGRFHVKKAVKVDNQSSFGLMALDSLGSNSSMADYLNQIDVYAATKSEATGTCIPGIRTYLGNTDATGAANDGGLCDVTQYFDKNATVFSESNAVSLYYNFEIVKDSNGYVCNYYNDDWSSVISSKRIYNPDKLLNQDNENVYIGFYASRIGTVEVTDIAYEQHTPTQEEIAAIEKDKWIDYDTVSVKTFNGDTTSSSDYLYRFKSNVTGTLSVSDDRGNTYINSQEIKSGDAVSFWLSDKGTELKDGTTTFTTVIKPYENSVDADGNKKYTDRLLLKDYSAVTVKDSVTKNSSYSSSEILYVSPDGRSGSKGTKQDPLDIYTALSYASAGQTIILKDGTYKLNKVLSIPYSVSGTEDNPIVLKAENTGKAVIDGSAIPKSSDSALFVKGDYWNIYGINVCNASDGTKGVHVSGNRNIIEMCNIYENGSTGLQISYSGGEPSVWWPSENLIKNCSSYYNCDSKQNDADGFAAKLSVGEGNIFDGCISNNNADDGYDLYAKDRVGYGPIKPVTIQNCLAYSNGILKDGSSSRASANGFKLGGEGLTGRHVLKNCVSWNNGGSGIMSNNGPDCRVYNCISVDNGYFSRNGGTASRNNYQLTPKNGDRYPYSTGYVLENVISFYTGAIKNSGTMAADKFTLKNQSESDIYKVNNYLCTNISKRSCANSAGTKVDTSWFKSVDYANVVPTRNDDGSIDMHGLFVLTDKAPAGIGAVIPGNEAGGSTQPTENPTKATESTTKATQPSTKATEAATKATEAATKATQPSTKATQPSTKAAESATKATQAVSEDSEASDDRKAEVSFEVINSQNENSFSVGTGMSASAMEDAVLSGTDKERAESGEDVKIELVSKKADMLSPYTLNMINSKLEGYVTNVVLDIELYKKIGTGAKQVVTKTNSPVSITVRLDSDAKAVPAGYARDYRVIRVHDNTAEILDSQYNAADNTITFVTDRFSIYAIAYKDYPADKEQITVQPTVQPTDNAQEVSADGVSARTSDTSDIKLYVVIMLIALIVTAIMYTDIFGKNKYKN